MRRRKWQGVTLFLAISASVVSASVCVLVMVGEYHSAQYSLDTHEREYQGWQAFRQTNPTYYDDNKEAVASCQSSLEADRNNFWLKRSPAELAGLFIVSGLASGAGGYVGTWGLLWLVGMGFHEFFRWLSVRPGRKRKARLDNQSRLHADISTEY
ncbi:MAG: hypothetical protein P8Z79_04720 [Sedimentisphaerales bacterium]|jgi:hypothetical protein